MADVHTDVGMPKLALPTFKTPTFLKKAAPTPKPASPPIALVNGVPENLTKSFSRKLDSSVRRWQYRGNYHYYGLLTRDGNKFYFQHQKTLPNGDMNIKLSPKNTTFRVRFVTEQPSDIDKWVSQTLNATERANLNVFFIKNPNDYFGKILTWTQNIWPVDKAPVMPESASQSLSHERNPYFI